MSAESEISNESNLLEEEKKIKVTAHYNNPLRNALALSKVFEFPDDLLGKLEEKLKCDKDITFSSDEEQMILEVNKNLYDFWKRYYRPEEPEAEQEPKNLKIGLPKEEIEFRHKLIDPLLEIKDQILTVDINKYIDKKLIEDFLQQIKELPEPEPAIRNLYDLETIFNGKYESIEFIDGNIDKIKKQKIILTEKIEQLKNLTATLLESRRKVEETKALLEKNKLKLINLENENSTFTNLRKKFGLTPRSERELNEQIEELKILFNRQSVSANGALEHQIISSKEFNTLLSEIRRVLGGIIQETEKAKTNPAMPLIDQNNPYSKLVLVRATDIEPEIESKEKNMVLRSLSSAVNTVWQRGTVHFTLNQTVSKNWETGDDWSARPIYLILPLDAFMKENGKPVVISADDTYFLGDLSIPKGSTLIIKEGVTIPISAEILSNIKIIVDKNPKMKCDKVLKGLPPTFSIINNIKGITKGDPTGESHYNSVYRDFDMLANDFIRSALLGKTSEAVNRINEALEKAKGVNPNFQEKFKNTYKKILNIMNNYKKANCKALEAGSEKLKSTEDESF